MGCGFRYLRNRIPISLSAFGGPEYQHIRGCVDILAQETDIAQMKYLENRFSISISIKKRCLDIMHKVKINSFEAH